MDRRTFLARTALVGGAAGLAGCLGEGAGTAGGETDGTATSTGAGRDGGTAGDGDGATATSTFEDGPPFGDHAATSGVRMQPYLGPEPGTATGTIVAFEDPSCPRCATFERQTVPKIRSELVEPGDATFVFRGYPVVYAWGKPATRALEATFARDEAAHWALLDYYFRNQDDFRLSETDVLAETESFLETQTDVDGATVVADVEAGTYDDRVQADLDAGDAAGAGGITPTVFLFRDGEYRTKARGSVSFSLVRTALGL